MLIGAEDLVRVDAATATIVRHAPQYVRESVVLSIAGCVSAVHFDDVEVARRFRSRYVDLVSRAEEIEQNAFAMSDPLLGPLFWSERGAVFRWPHGPLPPHATAFLADAVAMTAFFNERDDGIVSLHAATVAIPGAAATIIGDSNVGKTTTAIACARAGLRLYGDERCVIDTRSLVHPFARSINVRAAGRRLLLRDAIAGPDPIGERLRAHGDDDWNDVRLGELLGGWIAPPPEPLRAVFLISGTAREPGLESTTASRAAKAAPRWAQGAGRGIDKVARLVDLFSGTACYRLELGTPDASARAIAAALGSQRGQLCQSA